MRNVRVRDSTAAKVLLFPGCDHRQRAQEPPPDAFAAILRKPYFGGSFLGLRRSGITGEKTQQRDYNRIKLTEQGGAVKASPSFCAPAAAPEREV